MNYEGTHIPPRLYLLQFIMLWAYSTVGVAVCEFITKYLFAEWQYLTFLIILVAIDSVLGATAAWIRMQLSSSGFWMIARKLFVYFWLLITLHVLTYFVIHDGDAETHFFSWITMPLYTAMIVREVISIFENAGKVSPGIIPLFILKRLRRFDEEGKYIEDKEIK